VVAYLNKIILGRSTDGGGSGLKFFKIMLMDYLLFEHLSL